MSKETYYREKLAQVLLALIILTIVVTVCWYLRSVLLYMVLALVVTIMALPLNRLVSKAHIGRFKIPSWLSAVLSIASLFAILACLATLLTPLLRDVANEISMANVSNLTKSLSIPLASFNEWVVDIIPGIGPDFRIENLILDEVQKVVDVNLLSNVLGGLTSFIANMGVTIFAVIFIAFFLVKSPQLVGAIVRALVPDEMEERISKSLHEINKLIGRYFLGVMIEVGAVWLINFLGLWIIAQMGFKYSLSIAFLAGILNVVPYIGPLFGGILGVSMSLILHYAGAGLIGLDIAILPFVLILASIFIFTQLIDNYVFQPVIYSNSVKVHPLEIFIVFLIAAQIGGMLGMLAAVPTYTVLRVIAHEFFGNIKPIARLTSER